MQRNEQLAAGHRGWSQSVADRGTACLVALPGTAVPPACTACRYRNSNYQSKDIAHVQKHLAERMAFKVGGGAGVRVHKPGRKHQQPAGFDRQICSYAGMLLST